MSRTAAGFMDVNWSLPNFAVQWPGHAPFEPGDLGFGTSGACDLHFGGDAYVCHVETPIQTILDTYPDPGPYVNGKVDFQLGDLSASATTGANGVAATNLQLSQKVQKKGTYPLTATFTPTNGDTAKYTGSSDQVEFKQQVK